MPRGAVHRIAAGAIVSTAILASCGLGVVDIPADPSPAERGLVALLGPGAAGVLRRADLGIALVPLAPLVLVLPRDSNPFELEAEHITAP